MSAPLPARDDPSTPAMLRQGLDALVELNPSYDVDAGLARFEGASAASAAPSTGAVVLKIVVGSFLLVLGGIALAVITGEPDAVDSPAVANVAPTTANNPDAAELRGTDPRATNNPVPQPHDADAQSSEAPAMLASTDPVTDPVTDPAQDTAQDRGVVAMRSPQRRPRRGAQLTPSPTAAPEAPAQADPLLAEMQLLNATRKQVSAKRYRAALASVAAARELSVPRHFDEEWDALEILALAGSGHLEHAQRLATPYLERHARGRFNASIERALTPSKAADH